jgi:hypothetical protein
VDDRLSNRLDHLEYCWICPACVYIASAEFQLPGVELAVGMGVKVGRAVGVVVGVGLTDQRRVAVVVRVGGITGEGVIITSGG